MELLIFVLSFQEFVPHGRRAISRHPGSVLKSAATNAYPLETSLLHKLKNVAITDRNDYTYLQKDQESSQNEWWCVRQMFANSSRRQHNGDYILFALCNL